MSLLCAPSTLVPTLTWSVQHVCVTTLSALGLQLRLLFRASGQKRPETRAQAGLEANKCETSIIPCAAKTSHLGGGGLRQAARLVRLGWGLARAAGELGSALSWHTHGCCNRCCQSWDAPVKKLSVVKCWINLSGIFSLAVFTWTCLHTLGHV